MVNMDTPVAAVNGVLARLKRDVTMVSKSLAIACPCCQQRYEAIVQHPRAMTVQVLEALGLEHEVDPDELMARVQFLTEHRTINGPSGDVDDFRRRYPKLVKQIEMAFKTFHEQHGLD